MSSQRLAVIGAGAELGVVLDVEHGHRRPDGQADGRATPRAGPPDARPVGEAHGLGERIGLGVRLGRLHAAGRAGDGSPGHRQRPAGGRGGRQSARSGLDRRRPTSSVVASSDVASVVTAARPTAAARRRSGWPRGCSSTPSQHGHRRDEEDHAADASLQCPTTRPVPGRRGARFRRPPVGVRRLPCVNALSGPRSTEPVAYVDDRAVADPDGRRRLRRGTGGRHARDRRAPRRHPPPVRPGRRPDGRRRHRPHRHRCRRRRPGRFRRTARRAGRRRHRGPPHRIARRHRARHRPADDPRRRQPRSRHDAVRLHRVRRRSPRRRHRAGIGGDALAIERSWAVVLVVGFAVMALAAAMAPSMLRSTDRVERI